jgi:predicted glycoside hydrolase/deacetylase ChbG (UPF0249 family)
MIMHQSESNRLLGYPADARLLIINADDFGISHASNEATMQAFRDGVVRSTSLMPPCPWGIDGMRRLAEHPVPFGVHLTVICDMPYYKYRPLASADRVPSLLNARGTFHDIERMDDFVAHADIDELEIEFRAQIDAVLAAGLKPTHLDWHCIHNGGREDVLDLTVRLAKEHHLAVRVAGSRYTEQFALLGLTIIEHELMDSYNLPIEDKTARYLQMLRDLPVGLSEWAVHPALDTPEIQAIEPDSWQVRYTDYQFLMSPQSKQVIEQEGIILLSYEPIQQIWGSQ